MATKNNPGDYDCYENAEPDEPMFVLLARDPVAAEVVRDWIKRRGDIQLLKYTSRRQTTEAAVCAVDMETWYRENRHDSQE
jgi:hypothetical protein